MLSSSYNHITTYIHKLLNVFGAAKVQYHALYRRHHDQLKKVQVRPCLCEDLLVENQKD